MADTYFEVSRRAGADAVGSAELANDARRPAELTGGGAAPAGRPARRPRIEYIPFPPTSLPHRDLLILEQVAMGPGDRVCEVGVGSGATAVRAARLGPAEVVGLDVSAGAIEAVRELETRYQNLRLEVADVTQREQVAPLGGRFDVVFSCDTLEHVEEPDAYFAGIAELLAPGGRFFITFPNEPPEIMHGVTRFGCARDLEERVRAAGLSDVELGAARLSPRAANVLDALGRRPLAIVRAGVRAAQRARGEAGARAQRFDETSFHRYHRLWKRLAPAVNLYWYAVLSLMAKRAPAFDLDWGFRRTPFEDCQVVIRGVKPAPPAAEVS